MSHFLEDDVDVTGDELGDLFPFCGLHRVVALLVLAKVLHKHTRRGRHVLKDAFNAGSQETKQYSMYKYWLRIYSED